MRTSLTAVVRAADQKGLLVPTTFDHDGDPATPPLDPYFLDLAQAGFRAGGRAKGGEAAVAAVVLHQYQKMTLAPRGTSGCSA